MKTQTRVHASAHTSALAWRFAQVRAQTLALADPLSEADCQVQSMPDTSPTKWHLAHVTWFFETFVLERCEPGCQPFNPAFRVLFNSYYQGVGDQHPRPQRGLITRPGLAEVKAWRVQVDARIAALLQHEPGEELGTLMEPGLQHEQQHQELLLTDLKHLLASNPLNPVYHPQWPLGSVVAAPMEWVALSGGTVQQGHTGDGCAFDNETPAHDALLQPHALATRLVTHGEWLAFMDGGGYADTRWWMAAGWDWLRAAQPGQFSGQRRAAPHAARAQRPGAAANGRRRVEWTASPYTPYPGYRPWAGAVGEYHGKFMVNQMVLRGGSCATPREHFRASYRNFFPTDARWQFSGVRLAKDC